MRKWIVLGAVLGAFVVLVLVAAFNLDRWLDANRDLIEGQASQALARTVTIDDLEVSLWGGLGVRVTGLRVSEDPAYGDALFLSLEKGMVRVALWPALFGRIELSELVLDAPELRVVRDARGLSIDSLAASEGSEDAGAGAETVEEEASAFELRISSLRIVGGRLVYEDRTGPKPSQLALERLDLEMTDIGAEAPVSFDLRAGLLGAAGQNLSADGQLGPLLGEAAAPLAFDVRFTLDPLPIDALLAMPQAAAAMPTDTRAEGELIARGRVHGTAARTEFDLAFDATRMAVVMEDTFAKGAGTAFTLEARGQADETEARIEALELGPDRAHVSGDGRVALSEPNAYDLRLRAESLPLEAWAPLLAAFDGMVATGPFGFDLRVRGRSTDVLLPALDGRVSLDEVKIEMPDTPVVSKLDLDVTLAGRSASARDGRFELGGAPMQLELDVADINAPEVRFAVDAARLPLSAVGVLEPGTEDDDVLETLRVVGQADLREEDMALDARFASASGRLEGIAYTALQGRAEMHGTRLELHELEMKMLGGEVRLDGSLDSADAERPAFRGTVSLQNVQMSGIVASQMPRFSDVVSGRVDTTLSLSGRGFETQAILRSLTGKGAIEILDGKLEGVNIAEEVLSGATGVPGLTSWISPKVKERHPMIFAAQSTKFDLAKAAVEIEDGRLQTRNLAIETDDFGLTGTGSIGLDGSIDLDTQFRTSIELASTLVGVASPTRYLLDGQKRIVIPVKISGEVGAPKVRPDEKFLASALTRATVGAVGSLVGDALGVRRGGAGDGQGSKAASGTTPGADESTGEPPGDAEGAPGGEAEPAPDASTPTAPTKKKSVEDLIGEGLGEILKR